MAAILATDAGVIRRKKRSLGLVKAGYDAALTALPLLKIGAGVAVPKAIALGLLGKCMN